MPAERQYRHPVALTALRPFVRLSQRLERQVVAPSPEASPAPVTPATPASPARPTAATPPPTAAPEPPAAAAPPPPAPAPPAAAAPPVAASREPATVVDPATSTDLEDQYLAVDASVVPVPVESLNRLVLAVDELGSEMGQVRQAIRELTVALSDSQAGLARILTAQAAAVEPPAPDPLDAVTGPYVSGAPTPTPFTAPPTVPSEADDPFDPATLATVVAPPLAIPAAPVPAPAPPADPAPAAIPDTLGDLPIVSTGETPVVIGPIASLDELDAAIEHISAIQGVKAVEVGAFEGASVVLRTELARPLPLASLLRTGLGREVSSCRLVDGRIVVDFGQSPGA